jgi:hypothetical protein
VAWRFAATGSPCGYTFTSKKGWRIMDTDLARVIAALLIAAGMAGLAVLAHRRFDLPLAQFLSTLFGF